MRNRLCRDGGCWWMMYSRLSTRTGQQYAKD
jgi:hypothetical protein